MCGRFNLFTNPRLFADVFSVARTFDDNWTPAYNIAPTQKVLCIRDGEEREFFKSKWGLIPNWAKDAKIGNSCINPRVETVDTKPAFRAAFKKRRCLVPASGFYEWKTPTVLGARGLPAFASQITRSDVFKVLEAETDRRSALQANAIALAILGEWQGRVMTLRMTSPASIARKASLTSVSATVRDTIAAVSRRPV